MDSINTDFQSDGGHLRALHFWKEEKEFDADLVVISGERVWFSKLQHKLSF